MCMTYSINTKVFPLLLLVIILPLRNIVKMDRTRDYVKQCLSLKQASSSQKSSASVTSVRDDHKLSFNNRAENNNDDFNSRCSSVSTSVKLNFSKYGDDDDDRSSLVKFFKTQLFLIYSQIHSRFTENYFC